MKKQEIKRIIKNGGATLNNNLKSANLTSGYMVSMTGYETIIPLDSFNSITEIENTLQEYQKISKKVGAYIGLWINDNKIYIDLSKNYKKLGNAMKTGKQNNQLGIFNLNTMNEILL